MPSFRYPNKCPSVTVIRWVPLQRNGGGLDFISSPSPLLLPTSASNKPTRRSKPTRTMASSSDLPSPPHTLKVPPADFSEFRESIAKAPYKYFETKTEGNHVGLVNTKQTCYLNSLLQALFFVVPFRVEIYAAASSPKTSNPIIHALATLFTRMQCSVRSSIDTVELTDSFGWSASGSSLGVQHDVHELLVILLDSLGAPSILKDLHEFNVEDRIHCLACNAVRGVPSTQAELNLSCRVPNFVQSITEWQSAEVLPIDCDSPTCKGARQDSRKFLSFKTLPRVLNVVLRRLDFCMKTLQRVKVTTAWEIPFVITLTPGIIDKDMLFSGGGGGGGGGGDDDGKTPPSPPPLPPGSKTYDLVAILVHSGGAHGGHYINYSRRQTGDWVYCNDQISTIISHEDMRNKRGPELGKTAYLMMYAEASSSSSDDAAEAEAEAEAVVPSPPPDLEAQVKKEDATWQKCASYSQLSSSVASVLVSEHDPSDPSAPPTVLFKGDVMRDETVGNLLEHIVRNHPDEKVRLLPRGHVRLRFAETLYKHHPLSGAAASRRNLFPATAAAVAVGVGVGGLGRTLNGHEGSTLDGVYFPCAETADLRFETLSAWGKGRGSPADFDVVREGDMLLSVLVVAAVDGVPEAIRLLGEGASEPAEKKDGDDGGETLESKKPATLEAKKPHTLTKSVQGGKERQLLIAINATEHCTIEDFTKMVAEKINAATPDSLTLYSVDSRKQKKLDRLDTTTTSSSSSSDGPEAADAPELIPAADAKPIASYLKGVWGNNNPTSIMTRSAAAANPAAAAAAGVGPAEKPKANTLRSKYIVDGDCLVCYCDKSSSDEFESVWGKMTNEITINFNRVGETSYDHSMRVNRNDAVGTLMEKIGQYLDLSLDKFHLKKSATGEQIKDRSSLLLKNGLCENSIVHLEKGAGCGVGEVMFKLAVKTKVENGTSAEYVDIGSVAVDAGLTVKVLRDKVYELIAFSGGDDPDLNQVIGDKKPATAAHIRLQDKLTDMQVLRDERKLRAAILGLNDGRVIVITLLSAPEEVTADQFILQVKINLVEQKKIVAAGSVVIGKDWSLQRLKEALFEKTIGTRLGVSEARELGVAKAAFSKVSWVQASQLLYDQGKVGEDDNIMLCQGKTQMMLKDNNVIVVRSNVAKAAGEADKEEKSGDGETSTMSTAIILLPPSNPPSSDDTIKSSPWRGNVAHNIRKEKVRRAQCRQL